MLENAFIALFLDGKIQILLDCSKGKQKKLKGYGVRLKEVNLTTQEQGFLSILSDSPDFLDMLKKFIIRGMEFGKEKQR